MTAEVDMSTEKRELLYCFVGGMLSVLVPKKRGAGFLKVPYGHHHNQKLTHIANAANSDVFGLDGALDFGCGGSVYHGSDAVRAEYAAKIIPELERYYGFPSRLVSASEFWRRHPLSVQ